MRERQGLIPESVSQGGREMSDYMDMYCLAVGLIWFARPYFYIPGTKEFIGRTSRCRQQARSFNKSAY